MAETAGGKHCAYTLLDSGVHEFVFLESSKAAIEEFFSYLEPILKNTPHDQTARYIVDVTGGDREVSIVAMTQRFRRLETSLPHRARGRSAILHKPNIAITFFDGLIRALAPTRDVTRFFTADRREEALAWVLSDER